MKQLPEATAAGIKAIAIDMGPAYQKSVKEYLPKADVVFVRFHIMQNYSKAMQNQRRIEFRKANRSDKELMKGTHYLLLNADKLNEKQSEKLQALWGSTSYESMSEQLES